MRHSSQKKIRSAGERRVAGATVAIVLMNKRCGSQIR
jgi:hypothetical protein